MSIHAKDSPRADAGGTARTAFRRGSIAAPAHRATRRARRRRNDPGADRLEAWDEEECNLAPWRAASSTDRIGRRSRTPRWLSVAASTSPCVRCPDRTTLRVDVPQWPEPAFQAGLRALRVASEVAQARSTKRSASLAGIRGGSSLSAANTASANAAARGPVIRYDVRASA